MSKPTLDRCHTSREIESYLSHHGAKRISQVGSHAKWRAPGGEQIIVPCHSGDLHRGTLASIVKVILMAGLGVAVVACSYLAMITA